MRALFSLAGLLAILALGLFFAFSPSPQTSPERQTPAPKSTPDLAPRIAPAPPAVSTERIREPDTALPAPETPPVATTHHELARAFDAIHEAEEANTPEALSLLIRYGSSTNPDIRRAALDTIIRLDRTDATTLLRHAAKASEDPATIIDLLTTAEYLDLPPANLRDIKAQQTSRPEDAKHHQDHRSPFLRKEPRPATAE